MNRLIISDKRDIYYNLALEERLSLDNLGEVTLYLWQNDRSIILGRNQNAYAECDIKKIRADGVSLARRKSGGGAVYHDMGNLCYSFIAKKALYDEDKQFSVVISALSELGIVAERTGRNDIETSNKKISGNAFCHGKNTDLHHGTLLINSDLTALGNYLTVSPLKIAAKGIKSVTSRVENISKDNSSITVDVVKNALAESFRKNYGEYETITPDNSVGEKAVAFYSSSEWIYGENPPFDVELSDRLSFGELTLRLSVIDGVITRAHAFSDALDVMLPKKVENALLSSRLNSAEIEKKFACLGEVGAEIATFFSGKI